MQAPCSAQKIDALRVACASVTVCQRGSWMSGHVEFRAHPWPPKKEAFPQCKIVTYDAKFLGGQGCAHQSVKNQTVTLLHCTMNLQNVTILNRFSFWGARGGQGGQLHALVLVCKQLLYCYTASLNTVTVGFVQSWADTNIGT